MPLRRTKYRYRSESGTDREALKSLREDTLAGTPARASEDGSDSLRIFSVAESRALRELHDACLHVYGGQASRLGVELHLNASQLALISRLVNEAWSQHHRLVQNDPDYREFQSLLSERRAKVGTFGEAGFITEDRGTKAPRKSVVHDGDTKLPAITLPPRTYRQYQWELEIGNLASIYQHITTEDKGKGMLAKPLGESIKQVYWFVKYRAGSQSI